MRRLPIRLRVTAAFAVAMAVVLGAFALILYARYDDDLEASVEDGLRSRAALSQADGLSDPDDSFRQVLDSRGRVVDGTPLLAGRPILGRSEVERAREGPVFITKDLGLQDPDEADDVEVEEVRLLARPVRSRGQDYVVVVGESLGDVGESLEALSRLLWIGIPVVVVLVSLIGYGVVTAALRPVEAMRRRAAEIGAGEPGARLPVSPSGDELTRLADTLNGMLARLEESLARERRFVADASHELRTPLAVMKTEIELAQRDGRSREELRDALLSAGEETDRLTRLADDLLVLARSSDGRLPVERREVGVAELLDEVRDRFGEVANGRGIEVEAEPDLVLQADRLRLEQAVGNAVDNALRHGAGTITLVASRTGPDAVRIAVRDNGPGFPPDLIEHAFERFASGGDSAGAGLGLAIVQAVAESHGGKAVVVNLPGGGAEVRIDL